MKIAIIGSGYVGLVSGACFSELGFNVMCADKDKSKIDALKKGEIPIYEPGLDEVVARNIELKRLEFTTSVSDAVKNADAIFIAVGTPPGEDGSADLKYVYAVAEEVAPDMDDGVVIVTKSTVPVGTGERIREIISAKRPNLNFGVVSNPEFLREGCAVEDFLKPDRIVVGTDSEAATKVMQALYKPLTDKGAPIVFTDIKTSELIKYAANGFLAVRIGFINEIANICEAAGANIEDIATGIGYDHRIGNKYLSPGPGYGGSCLPKDTLALHKTASDAGVSAGILSSVIKSNDSRKIHMAEKVVQASGGDVNGKNIAVLGLAFKANTDDIRFSPAIDMVKELVKAGATISAHDPKAIEHSMQELGNSDRIEYFEEIYDAIEGADALVIVTEWEQFRNLDLSRVKSLLKEPVIVDLRNLYSREVMRNKGFTYISIGRPE